MTLSDWLALGGISIAIATPLVSKWVDLHLTTKEAYREFVEKIIDTLALLYIIGLLVYYYFSYETVTKGFVYNVGFTFTALAIVISFQMRKSISKRMFYITESLSKGQMELMKMQIATAEMHLTTVEKTTELATSTRQAFEKVNEEKKANDKS
ncbi:hypothetical protein [Fibrella aquatica]|uniref:hypothetical protein n=1 Tax=Fibrella aquatica TaxID=3242487 RepID=UPI0035222313